MLRIEYPRHGALLNHNHGSETADGLTITLRGKCTQPGEVLVNGIAAKRQGEDFTCEVTLTEKVNVIRAESDGKYGESCQQIKVLWDKASFKRYNFFIDDHSFFLTDIAKDRPSSLFDHFYLKGLQDIHRRYGTKFTLNCFYRNDHHGFEMKDFPDTYKGEWIDNSDWLRLSFHAYSEFPDRPYTSSDPTKLLSDYDLLKSEITRFAGAETFIEPVVVHWAVTSREGVKALVDKGYANVFTGGFRGDFALWQAEIDAGRDPMVSLKDYDWTAPTDIGYYLTLEEALYLYTWKAWMDFSTGALFYGTSQCLCNANTQEQIRANLAKTFALAEPFGFETYKLASHEQYSFKYYKNFVPDHLERMDLACRICTENGAKPVFFVEGLLGNKAWDK